VAVRGTRLPEPAHRGECLALAMWGADHFPASGVAGMARLGTAEECFR